MRSKILKTESIFTQNAPLKYSLYQCFIHRFLERRTVEKKCYFSLHFYVLEGFHLIYISWELLFLPLLSSQQNGEEIIINKQKDLQETGLTEQICASRDLKRNMFTFWFSGLIVKPHHRKNSSIYNNNIRPLRNKTSGLISQQEWTLCFHKVDFKTFPRCSDEIWFLWWTVRGELLTWFEEVWESTFSNSAVHPIPFDPDKSTA